MTILTTNHVEKIEKAMLRQGRCPVVIVNPPDAAAVIRLVQVYGRGLLADDFDYDAIGLALRGQIPATIREAVEQARVAAVGRLGSPDIKGHVTTQDALDAATFAVSQAKFAEQQEIDTRSDLVKSADALGGHITTSMRLFAEAAAGRNGKYAIEHENVT